MKETIVISGFPGVGKTEYFKNQKYRRRVCLDSDSSEFSWIKDKNGNNTKERNPEFPMNYINHIKDNIGKVDIIFVSSHDVVRKALKEANIRYVLAYPKITAKEEYIRRYRQRGNSDEFIKFINDNWDNFINDMKNETFPYKKELEEWQFLSSIGVMTSCEVMGYCEG
ncbi:hypothetical protein [Turicibacter sanguinis]|uniref:hypothetical protein n=1 Tax=Turicibacter sanguinis TaxID=154288 RepID=UPI00232F101E|nr:hypothetical protein [Turicibacter sanguinis]MDB8575588.1 hypothetical protein [Turicibacter sanguinis]MDB8578776.1 hypothetical protein [Turicibacter sanguinis]MDB8584099.1 hypothetical protein [Turicibacter sanguinis]MDB8587988.1 hypothetical protein [Turicibacter sanguinis]MDB8598166.1 hypothetical protein [Turicibacter sanguinis]